MKPIKIEKDNINEFVEFINSAKRTSNLWKFEQASIDKLRDVADKNSGYVYIFFVDDEVCYIGKSEGDLINRLSQHSKKTADSVGTKYKEISAAREAGKDVFFTVIEVESKPLAETIERGLMEQYNLLWNKRKG